jgi:hypothetical protein
MGTDDMMFELIMNDYFPSCPAFKFAVQFPHHRICQTREDDCGRIDVCQTQAGGPGIWSI